MRRYLLDTCVVSELVRSRRNAAVVEFVDGKPEEALFLSALTIGELEKGVEKLLDPERKDRLRAWIGHDLARRFQGRVLPVDAEVATTWGRMLARSELRGEPLPVVDSLIAATALAHHLVVVTRNTPDLERCGAEVQNPWR